ncbi:unnamed protein product, partial [Closterium sp. NIES-53]
PGGLAERREPVSHPVSPVSSDRRVPLPSPPASSLPVIADPASDRFRAEHSTVTRLLATVVTDPSFESTASSALVAELVDFSAHCRLDYAASLVAESESVCPPSVGGECALGTDVLEDRQEDLECLAAAAPHLVSMLLAPEGDPDAPDIPTPRSYAEGIAGEYSSQWQTAMDAEMASWKSTGTYVDEVPPPGANSVSGMWIFRVKRPPGSPPVFKARYVARGFSQREGVDFFQTFSPTPKMTTLRVLLHVAAQCDYELHSLEFSTAFLQGSLHEEIWLRRPPGFTGSFPLGSQWSLWRPVYGLRQAPREWHGTLRTTLAALGFAPSTADPSLFLRIDTSLPPFYVLVYVDDLVFATADTEALALVKSELQKRHTCTDLGELRSYLGLQITRDRARRTITLTQSHMVQQVLQRFVFTWSSAQATPLATGHSLSTPPSDESVEPSGPYPKLVGCLMYLMTCTRPDLAYPLGLLARYVAPGRHRKLHMDAAKRVLRYLCSTSGMGLVLGGRGDVVLTGHSDASWLYATAMAAQELRWLTYLLTDLGERPSSPPVLYVDNKAAIALCQEHRLEHRTKPIALRYFLARELQQRGQLHLTYVATRANTADIFTKALLTGDHQRFCTLLGLVPTLPHLLLRGDVVIHPELALHFLIGLLDPTRLVSLLRSTRRVIFPAVLLLMARLVTLRISLVASVALLLLATAAQPALAGGESAASIPADSTDMAASAASRRVLLAAPAAAVPPPAPAVGAPSTVPPSSGAPSSPPASSKGMMISSNIKSADVSKSIDLLNYLAYTSCPFPSVKTMFLPSNQAWSDAFEGYKKKRSSGGLYDALDAIVNGDKLKTPKDKSKIISPTSPLSVLSGLAADCKSALTSGTASEVHSVSYTFRATWLISFARYLASPSLPTLIVFAWQCNAAGMTFKTAFNGNNLNFKCNSTNSGFISGSDPLASDASAGTPSAVAKIDDKSADFFYVSAVVFPSDLASLPGTRFCLLQTRTWLYVPERRGTRSSPFSIPPPPLTLPQSQFPPPHPLLPLSFLVSPLSLPTLLPLTPNSPPSHSQLSSLSLPISPHSQFSSLSLPCILLTSMYPPHFHVSSSLPCILVTSMYPRHFHASSSLPCILLTSMHPPHFHVSSSLPCILLTSMYPPHFHVSSSLPCILLTSMYPPHFHVSSSLPCILLTSMYPHSHHGVYSLLFLVPPPIFPTPHSHPRSPHSWMTGAAATVSRLFTALLVLAAALVCIL